MNKVLFCCVLAVAAMVFPAVEAGVDVGDSAGEDSPADPIDYIRRSLQAYPIVCLAEGGHQAKEPHQFLRRVLGDKTILKTVDVVKSRLNTDIEISGIVASRVDLRTRHSQEVVERLRERFKKLVFRTVIRENVRLAECPSFGEPITTYDSKSRGAEDFRALAEEVIKQERRS